MFWPYKVIFRKFTNLKYRTAPIRMSMHPALLHIVVHTKMHLFENEHSFRFTIFSFCDVHVVPPSLVGHEQLPENGLVRPKHIAITCDFNDILN
jgi:hypothetical protein